MRQRAPWPSFAGCIGRPFTATSGGAATKPEDAQDLTQSFFQHLLEEGTLRRASRERGRFRSFLLGAVNQCLADEHARSGTWKRGGRAQFVSLDELRAEENHHQQMAPQLSPDELLDARWAGVLLEQAIAGLRAEFSAKGETEIFDTLRPFLAGEKSEVPYQVVAEQLGVTLGAIKTLIHRLRRDFAAAVRREVMHTVSAPHETDDELRHLRAVFAMRTQRHAT